MKIRTAKIVAKARGGSIEVDGQELPGVRAASLDMSVRKVPTLTLELLLHEVEVEGEVHVIVPARTRESLLALGWKPPAKEVSGD